MQSVPPSLAGSRAPSCSPPSATATSCSITPTTRSTRWSSSCAPPPTTRTCWPSSRRCTACGRNAPVVEQLLEAAANGKDVAVLVELKARFDEESNIGWAKALEREGVHVVYGLLGLKTHCKALQVVRREGDRIRRYIHLGTGNYNSVTTKQYTDLGYLTADDDIGADANLVFNHLTGGGQATEYRKLLVAPVNLRQGIAERIDREIAHAEAGREAHLIFKMNSLVDKPMIRKLYRASQAGVKIDLNVRGMCCLRPGVPGVSENITEQQRGRALPRAQPHLLVPQRRRRGGAAGQRRPHAAQPQPPRRDHLPGAGQGHPAPHPRRDPADLHARQP